MDGYRRAVCRLPVQLRRKGVSQHRFPDDYEQWEYTTADGVPLLLALGPSKALILADTEESFVTVNVLGDWAMGTFDISREDLEEIAEGFHFSVVP